MGDWKKSLQDNYGGQRKDKGSRNDFKNNRYENKLPENYLKEGYFDNEGSLKEELLTDIAMNVAKSFGKDMKNSQLRRFYGHAKTAEKSFLYSDDDNKFILDIKQLDPFVAEAKGKEKVPTVFYDFIHKNIRNINSVKDIQKGFLPHFQAVVAYFTYYYPRSN